MKRVIFLFAMPGPAVFAGAADVDWPRYGGDDAQTRHSALTQIHRGNVAKSHARLEIRHW